MKPLLRIATLYVASLTALPTLAADSALQSYLAAKGQQFHQTNTSAPVLITAENPFRFYSAVSGADSNSLIGVTLVLPKKQTRALTNYEGEFELEQSFSTKKQLDTVFGLGTYTLLINSGSGSNRATLKLLKETFPPVPHVANWSDLQEVEPELPVTISWDPFTNGTTKDFVMLDISEAGDDSVAFTSPGLLDVDALRGTNLFFDIPAEILDNDRQYDARLIFVKSSDLQQTNIPGATGLGGFYRQTSFPISTLPPAPAAGRIQFSARRFATVENAGSVLITITRSGDENSVTVNLATSNGSASSGADYGAVSTTVTLPAGVVSTDVLIPVLDDFVLEGSETVNLTLSAPTGGAVLGNRSAAVLTIQDDEVASAGTLQFLRNAYTVTEKGKTVTLTLKRSGGNTGVVTVNYHTINGSASGGSDYVGTNGTVTFKSRAPSATFRIPILNDAADEPNETFVVVLGQPTGGAALGTNLTATVTVTDDDVAGTVALGSASFSTNENGGHLALTVKRTGGSAGGVTVDYATQNGVAIGGQDFSPFAGTLTFGSNELSKVIFVPILQDTLAEVNETFALGLSNPTGGAVLGALTNSVLTIVDDESSVTLTNASYVVTESGPSVSVTVVRSGALISPVSVTLSTLNGSALSTGDYAGTNLSLAFAANVSSRVVVIPIVNDTLVEGVENFQVRLSNPQGGVQLGAITNATVTISDNDFAGAIHFSAATYSVTEGTANASINVFRTGGASSGVTVQFATGGGSAAAGSDYTPVNTVLTFAAGETNKTVLIPIVADSLSETPETINLALSNATGGATLGAQKTAVVSLLNKPDPNAVPITGPAFMSGSIGGKAFSIANAPAKQQMIIAGTMGTGLNISASWTTGSGMGTQPHLFSIVPVPFAVGTFSMDNEGTHGLMNYTISSFQGTGKAWSVADGSASVGTYGTFTFDAIDTVNKMVSGRFSFHARETTDGVAPNGGFIEITGKFRCSYMQ